MSDVFAVWMLTGKEVSSVPTAVFAHGQGGLFSHAALSRPAVSAAIEGWRSRRRKRREKAFDPAEHPRAGAGSPDGGQFVASGTAGAAGGAKSLPAGVKIFNYDTDDFNKVFRRKLEGGFEEMYWLNGPKDGGAGEYSFSTNAYGSHYNAPTVGKIKAESVEAALEKGMQQIDTDPKYKKWLDGMIDYREKYEQNDTLLEAMSAYHENATPRTLKDLVDEVLRDKVSFTMARRAIEEHVPVDENGEVTLYRGGSEGGLSWSLSKSEAERFARYGFGGVPIQASGLMGIAAIRSGAADKPVTVHEQKFKRGDLLVYIPWGEQEVLVRPSALRKRGLMPRKGEAGKATYDEDTEDWMPDYFLADDLDALLGGGARVKEAAPVQVETAPVMAAGDLTMPSTPAGDAFVNWAVLPRAKSWDESKHPRGGKGSHVGGKFVPEGSGQLGSGMTGPVSTEDAQAAAAMNYGNQPRTPKEEADMNKSDDNLQALQDRNDGKITQEEFEKKTGMGGAGGFAKSDERPGPEITGAVSHPHIETYAKTGSGGKVTVVDSEHAHTETFTKPKNLSQQTDADAAKRGMGHGKTDFEKPGAASVMNLWDKMDADSKSSVADHIGTLLSKQGYTAAQISQIKKDLIGKSEPAGDGVDHTNEADWRTDANGKKRYL